MTIGLIGFKMHMSVLFLKDGSCIPVSVIKIKDNFIIQIKKKHIHGYNAIQIATKNYKKYNKPTAGLYKKINLKPKKIIKEFKVNIEDIKKYTIKKGKKISVVDIFKINEKVSIIGNSKGKGFAGVVKRHNFKTQDHSHGNSLSHRAHGSVGQCQDPGKVFKGKKMAGRMGNTRCTEKNKQILMINNKKKLIFIKGSIPGYKGTTIIIRKK